MANPTVDPLESLIADGKIRDKPLEYHHTPKIVLVDFEHIHANLVSKMNEVYGNDYRIRNNYAGNQAAISASLNTDFTMLANYLLAVCYNKLRAILERVYPTARPLYMNPRAPVHNMTEFPQWLASTLGSIGPIILQDGPKDQYIVYATARDRANTYGRAAITHYLNGPYSRIMGVLRSLNVTMATFDMNSITGSAFPTLVAEINTDQSWNVIGTVHPTHYENEDIARAILLFSPAGTSPFGDTGFTADYVDNAEVLTALAAAPAPDNIPVGHLITSPGRPVDHQWDVNYFGVQPAVAATASIPASPAGIWIIGRGTHRYYAHRRAIDITNTDCLNIIRNRLMR